MKCLGRTRSFRRCQNQARRLFCWHHRFQALLGPLFLLSTVGVIAGLYQDLFRPLLARDDPPEEIEFINPAVDQAVHRAFFTYEENGISGVRISVEECYAGLSASDSVSDLMACMAMDFTGMIIDESMTETLGFPRYDFFLRDQIDRRLTTGASTIGLDPDSDTTDRIIARLVPLAFERAEEISAERLGLVPKKPRTRS